MPIGLQNTKYQTSAGRRLSVLCALALVCAWSMPAAADSLSWRDGIKEGERRLERQELEPAEGCFRQALRDVKKDRGSTADDVAHCLERLAAVLQMEDITEDSVSYYKQAIKVLSRAHGRQNAVLLPDLMALGAVMEGEGQYKKAIKLYGQAVAIADLDPGSASLTLADCQHSLGRANFKNGRSLPAETLYRSSLALIMKQKSLPSTSLIQDVISDYSDLLEKTYGPGKGLPSDVRSELLKDRLEDLPQKQGISVSSFEKEVTLRFARDTFEKIPASEREVQTASPAKPLTEPSNGRALRVDETWPAPVSQTAQAPEKKLSNDLANDLAGADGISQQRIAFYQRMIAVDVKTLGPDHPSVARDLSGLGAVYMADGHYDDARLLFMRALKIYEKVYGGDALLVKRTRTMMELINENQVAEVNGNAAGNDFVSDLPSIPVEAQKLDIAISLNYLAALCYSLGKIEDAEKIYAWAVADTYLATGEQSLLLAAGLKDYARVLRSAGNVPRAEILEADARAILRRVLSQKAVRSYH